VICEWAFVGAYDGDDIIAANGAADCDMWMSFWWSLWWLHSTDEAYGAYDGCIAQMKLMEAYDGCVAQMKLMEAYDGCVARNNCLWWS
jgi:hypothetical protein